MSTYPALDTALRLLKLPAFSQHYERLAQEAGTANLTYEHYLQALTEQELAQRDVARQRRYLQQAGFPVLKELADFDWSALPQLNRARVLTLAQGHYLEKPENVLLVGNPGLGKTHIATALGICAVRQGQRVRSYTAAGLTAELIQAQRNVSSPTETDVTGVLGAIARSIDAGAVRSRVAIHPWPVKGRLRRWDP